LIDGSLNIMSACRTCGLAVFLLVAGCSGGPVLAPVGGLVTVAGKPVTNGTIMFLPPDGKGAVGSIGPDGRYTLTTFHPGDGALVGDHQVTIRATRVDSGSMAPASLEEELRGTKGKVLVPGKVHWLVPERYSQPATSDLKATVKTGAQTIDFDLPAK
jgi:hypothetical protein